MFDIVFHIFPYAIAFTIPLLGHVAGRACTASARA